MARLQPRTRKKNRRKNSWTVDEARKFLECSRNEDDPLYPLWVLILVLGLRALSDLQVRQYPKTENAVVTITTYYYGADAQTIAGFITQPLEQAIAQAQGIDYLSSTSVTGVSTITVTLRLNYEATRALTEIQTQVTSVRNQLPPAAQQPVLTVQVGETIDAM